jgi:phytoene dehydrogenase-like protein
MSAPSHADAVIIGAGFAGMSAATRLAASGSKVVVVEEAPRLGGRASSFIDRDTGERVDNGQHVLFGCYRETYAFLRRIGAADRAPL